MFTSNSLHFPVGPSSSHSVLSLLMFCRTFMWNIFSFTNLVCIVHLPWKAHPLCVCVGSSYHVSLFPEFSHMFWHFVVLSHNLQRHCEEQTIRCGRCRTDLMLLRLGFLIPSWALYLRKAAVSTFQWAENIFAVQVRGGLKRRCLHRQKTYSSKNVWNALELQEWQVRRSWEEPVVWFRKLWTKVSVFWEIHPCHNSNICSTSHVSNQFDDIITTNL